MKRLYKRLAAGVTAACMCMALVVPMESSADTVTPGDLNGDGYINVNDASILQGYLNGRCELTNPGAADLDQDYVITSKDTFLLTRHLSQNTILPTQGNELTVPAMESRNYTVYDYDDGDDDDSNNTFTYTLNANVSQLSLEDEVMPTAGNIDDRVPTSEIAVVQLTSASVPVGTGFIVGDNVIATNAHCVYHRDSASFRKRLSIVVKNADSSDTLATIYVKEAHVYTEYTTTDDDILCNKYDYALLYVEDDLSEYGAFDLGIASDEFMTSGSTIYTSGFPSVVSGEVVSGVRYGSSGTIGDIRELEQYYLEYGGISCVLRNHQIKFTSFVSNGNSGGPVYIKNSISGDESYTAIGLVNSGVTPNYYGIRVTPSLLRFYKNNSYIGSTVS